MKVTIDQNLVNIDPKTSIGKGGEADVFLHKNYAIKIFKSPDHPDFITPEEKLAAEKRIDEHQSKLLDFPKNLPSNIMSPITLVYDSKGKKIIGYTMNFVKDSEKIMILSNMANRQTGINNTISTNIFKNLRDTVSEIHKKKVIIGDFNDLNILVNLNNYSVYLIDADSYQYGKYICNMFTDEFVDPLLCDPQQIRPILIKQYVENSDWYAFSAMLMQSLLLVGPYDGVYKPSNVKNKINHVSRPLHRISIFDGHVKTPKWSYPHSVLPDDLLDYLYKVFTKDLREEFPPKLLDMRWDRCDNCDIEYGTKNCPICHSQKPGAVVSIIEVRGNVTSEQIFETTGQIISGKCINGSIYWMEYKDKKIIIHNNKDKWELSNNFDISPGMKFRINDSSCAISENNLVRIFEKSGKEYKRYVDVIDNISCFDSDGNTYFWVKDGQMNYDISSDNYDFIGSVLPNQAMIWSGPEFGLGFYRAGQYNQIFLFDKSHPINDNIKYSPISGNLLDSNCIFSSNCAWFFTSLQDGSTKINRCTVYDRTGNVIAKQEASRGDGSWLGEIRGKSAFGNDKNGFILSTTDNGIVKAKLHNGSIELEKEFPDTAPFVSSKNHIFPGNGGLYIVGRKSIKLLKMG